MFKVAVGTTDGEFDDEGAALANFHGAPLGGKEGTRRFAVAFALVLTFAVLTDELVGGVYGRDSGGQVGQARRGGCKVEGGSDLVVGRGGRVG